MSLFPEAEEGASELLDRFEKDPESISPGERYAPGLSFITTSLGPESSQLLEDKKKILFDGGAEILIQALHEIRIDDDLPEKEKLFHSFETIKHIDFFQLPDSEEANHLFAVNMLTMMMGFETRIRQEISDGMERFRIGNLELVAMVTLAGKTNELDARQQLEYLEEKVFEREGANEEIDKELILRWGQRLIRDGVSVEEVFEMGDYFKERGDGEARKELEVTLLERELAS